MKRLEQDYRLAPFVKDVFLMENSDPKQECSLSFYADGFPGIMYTETEKPILLLPKDKLLSPFFLYGQTIEPLSLEIKGAYRAIVFKLYPFAARLLLGINPKVLNDDCYNLLELTQVDTTATMQRLRENPGTQAQQAIIHAFVLDLLKSSSANPDYIVKLAINLIISSKGTLPIKELRERLYITERTFERRFATEVGVTPKQFARIIQFNFSKEQLRDEHYLSLTEISYDNGFADQSHFIRAFKRFTGQTPREFQRHLS